MDTLATLLLHSLFLATVSRRIVPRQIVCCGDRTQSLTVTEQRSSFASRSFVTSHSTDRLSDAVSLRLESVNPLQVPWRVETYESRSFRQRVCLKSVFTLLEDTFPHLPHFSCGEQAGRGEDYDLTLFHLARSKRQSRRWRRVCLRCCRPASAPRSDSVNATRQVRDTEAAESLSTLLGRSSN